MVIKLWCNRSTSMLSQATNATRKFERIYLKNPFINNYK